MISTFKVGDTINAKLAPENASTEGLTYQWYADGTAINLATTSSLNITSDMYGKKIKVVVTDDAGKTFESAESAQVTEDKSANVTLADASGLQANGKGLVSDVLSVSYGSALGTPQSVTWYYNDTVVKSYTNQAGELTYALMLVTADGNDIQDGSGNVKVPAMANCKDGSYYVVIVNTAGQTFTSNTLELVYDEEPGVVSAIAVSDDLTTNTNIAYAANDTEAVVSIQMPKVYDGKFYVYENSVTNYTNTNCAAVFTYVKGTTLKEMTTANKMTEKNCLDPAVVDAKSGIEYTDEFGVTTLMFDVGSAANGKAAANRYLVRGKEYKVVFDQDSASTHISATGSKDFTASEPTLLPYLTAPEKIEIVTAALGEKAVVNLLDAEGNILSYLGDKGTTSGVALAGFSSFVLYGNTSAAKGTTQEASAGEIEKGVWTSGAVINAASTNSYFVAEAKTTAGVFAEKTATITSEFKAKNMVGATEVKLAEDSTTPENAAITLKDVVTTGKVYVVAAADESTKGKFNKDDSTTYRGSVEVKAADGTATVENVFKDTDIGGKFTAYFIPDDTATFAQTASKEFTLAQTAGSLEYDATGATTIAAATLTTGNPAIDFTALPFKVKDQFGGDIPKAGTTFAAVQNKTATVKAVNAGGAYNEAATAKYSVTSTGAVTLDIAQTGTGIDIGDGFDVDVLGTTIAIRANQEVGATGVAGYSNDLSTATAANPYKVTVGTTELIKDNTKALVVATADNLKLALAKFEGATEAREVTMASGVNSALDMTVGEYVTYVVPADQTFSGTVINKGTITCSNSSKSLTVTGVLKNYGTISGDGGDALISTDAAYLEMYNGAEITNSAAVATTAVLMTAKTAEEETFTIAQTGTGAATTTVTTVADDTAIATSDRAAAAIGTARNVHGGDTVTITTSNQISTTAHS